MDFTAYFRYNLQQNDTQKRRKIFNRRENYADRFSCRDERKTGIIGGLLAWPVAILFMGKAAGDIAFYAYIVPFLVSTVGGSIIAGIILFALEKNGTLKSMQNALNK